MASYSFETATYPMEKIKKTHADALLVYSVLPVAEIERMKIGKRQQLGTRNLHHKYSSTVELKLRQAAEYYAPKKLEDFPAQRRQYEALVEEAANARRAAESAERHGAPEAAATARATVSSCEEKQREILEALAPKMAGDPVKLKLIKQLYTTLIRDDGHHPQAEALYNAMTRPVTRAAAGPSYSLAEVNAIKARAPAGLSTTEALAWWEEVGRPAEEAERRAVEEEEYQAYAAERAAAAAEEATLMRHANSLLAGTGFVPLAWRPRAAARAEELRAERARQEATAKAERDAETDAAIARQDRGETIPRWQLTRCAARRAELAEQRAARAAAEFPTLCVVPTRAARVWGAAMSPAAPPPVAEPKVEAVPSRVPRVRVINEAELEAISGVTKTTTEPDDFARLAPLFAGIRRATQAANEERKRMEAYLARPRYHAHMSLAEWEDWEEECAEDAAAEEERDAWKEFNQQLRHMPESASIFVNENLPAGSTIEDAWAVLDEWEHQEYQRSTGKLPYDEDDDEWEPTPDEEECANGGAGAPSAGARNGKTQRVTTDPLDKLGASKARAGRKGDKEDHDGW